MPKKPDDGTQDQGGDASKPEDNAPPVDQATAPVQPATEVKPLNPFGDSGAKMVRVKCTSHNRPWANNRPLLFGDEETISEADAKMMEARQQVFVMGDA